MPAINDPRVPCCGRDAADCDCITLTIGDSMYRVGTSVDGALYSAVEVMSLSDTQAGWGDLDVHSFPMTNKAMLNTLGVPGRWTVQSVPAWAIECDNLDGVIIEMWREGQRDEMVKILAAHIDSEYCEEGAQHVDSNVSVEWYVDFIAAEYGRLYGIPQDDLPTYDRLWLDNFTPNTKENAHQMAINEPSYEGPIVNDTELTVNDRDYESAKRNLLAACMAISPNGKVQAGFSSAFNAMVRDNNSPRDQVLYLAGMLIDGVRHGNWPVSA